jgi:16S rRNA G966 N2-methylase RsmD
MRDRPENLLEYAAPEASRRYTHYLFRYPAKFHPPVARALLERHTKPGDCVLDCFSGSGTLLVEAAVSGRSAIGSDVDPVAAFVSRVKAKPLDAARLRRLWARLETRLETLERSSGDYDALQWEDIDEGAYAKAVRRLSVPAIPNLFHWFRRYVLIDLARIKKEIAELKASKAERDFFLLCFASIIRAASNADPVPVSGLEVTSHMKARDKEGRVINPFALYTRAMRRALQAMEDYNGALADGVEVSVLQADATRLTTKLKRKVDAVITSPPYHGAVDYYRRHQLEMFWLDFTSSQEDRLALLDHYIGRLRVPARDPLLKRSTNAVSSKIEEQMRAVNGARANGFRHYSLAMHLVFEQLSRVLDANAPAIFIVGHSTWNNSALDTSELFEELSAPWFELSDYYSYPVSNRYMSYSRHNGASIDREYVLVFSRRPD